MIDVTGSLQIKNKIYQAVLSFKQNNKWKTKWVSTKIPAVKGNKKIANAKLEEIRLKFQEEINSKSINNEKIQFIDYMKKWLKMIKSSVEETTYIGYEGVINGRMTDYFGSRDITLQEIKPKHIQDFYGHLLGEGLSGNTVKHYHANIRKALQYAMRTDIIPSNPADKVELPKIQKYNPSFYTSDEVKGLLSEVVGTKLEIPVMIDCFYGFRKRNLKQIRFHDLRHSCASILLKNGANMKEIQAWLGHSTYNTTADIYAHLDTSSVLNTGKVISNVFEGKS